MPDEFYEVRPLPEPLPGLKFGVYRVDRLSGLKNAAALCYDEAMAEGICLILNAGASAKKIIDLERR